MENYRKDKVIFCKMGKTDSRGRVMDHLPLIIWFLALSLFVGCATGIEISEKDSHAYIIKNIPFYPQEYFQCGPASLAAVLNYWGISVTPENIARDIYSQSARGTLNIDMIIYAQGKGLDVSQYSGGMDDLREKIKSNYPLIVLVDYGFSIFQVNHFMVVVGYNDDDIIVNSGKREKKFIPTKEFIRDWERTKFWTLQIKPKQL